MSMLNPLSSADFSSPKKTWETMIGAVTGNDLTLYREVFEPAPEVTSPSSLWTRSSLANLLTHGGTVDLGDGPTGETDTEKVYEVIVGWPGNTYKREITFILIGDSWKMAKEINIPLSMDR